MSDRGRGGRGAATLLAVAALTAAAGARAAAPSGAALRAAAKAADAALDDPFLKPGPGPAAAVQRQWTLARAWVADWLGAHPAAPPAAAAAALKAASGLTASAVRLDARSLLFAVTRGSLGDAFILRQGDDGRVLTAWAVEAPGAAQAAAFPELQAWSPSRASSACRDDKPGAQAGRCGPLTADAGLLAPQADGAGRFVLRGDYAQGAGATRGELVSVWRWDGREAQPLLARPFTIMAEQSQPLIAVTPGRMRVGTKGDWRQLFACGACEGRQMTTDVRLPARGAAWGPSVSRTPEVDAVDDLYDRVAQGRPAADLAEPAVVAAVQAQVAAARAQAKGPAKPSELLVLSMLSSWKVVADGPRRRLCLTTDAPGPQLFTLARAGPRWRVTAMRGVTEAACAGPGSHS